MLSDDVQPVKKVLAMAPKSQLEKLEERIALNNEKIAALKEERAAVRPGALEEHDQRIERHERWKAIQERLLLLVREDASRLT